MVEIKNQFANHLLFWAFVIPLVAILALPSMLPAKDFAITDAEMTFFNDVIGKDASEITRNCDALFDQLFIKTNIAPAFRDFFAPSPSKYGPDVKSSMIATSFSRNYNNAMWLMVYRGLWRITGLWTTVLAVILAAGIPCLVDGLSVRARKSYNFQFHNPVVFWTASHSLIFVVGLGVFLPFLPYSLSPMVLLGFCVVFCGALWITATNFQTGN